MNDAPQTEEPPKFISGPGGGRAVYARFQPGEDAWDKQFRLIKDHIQSSGVDLARLVIKRKAKGDLEFKQVAEIGADGFEIGPIVDKFGGGKYQFVLMRNDKIEHRYYVEADDRLQGELDRLTSSPGGGDPAKLLLAAKEIFAGNNASQGGAFSDVAKLMLEMQAKQRSESATLLVGLATAFAPVIAAFISRPSQTPSDKLIELLATRPQTDVATSLQFLKEMKALSTDKNARPEPEENAMDKLMKMLPIALPTIASAFLPKMGGAMPPTLPMNAETIPATPAPQSPGQPSAVAPPPANNEEAANRQALAIYAAMLEAAAKNDAPTDSFADTVAGILKDEQWDALIELLERPDWLEIITAHLPQLKPYPEWLIGLRTDLIALTQDDAPEPPAPTAPPQAPATTAPKAVDTPQGNGKPKTPKRSSSTVSK